MKQSLAPEALVREEPRGVEAPLWASLSRARTRSLSDPRRSLLLPLSSLALAPLPHESVAVPRAALYIYLPVSSRTLALPPPVSAAPLHFRQALLSPILKSQCPSIFPM